MWMSLGEKYLNLAIEQAGSVQKLSELTGVPRSTINNWLAGCAKPTIDKFGRVMELIGVIPQRVGQETTAPVEIDDSTYTAVPIVENPDLIVGDELFVPVTNIASHALPTMDAKEVISRPHTIAITIEDNDMAPLIRTGDLVYVDRDDTTIDAQGSICLVRDAKEDRVCLRRVHEYEEDDAIFLLFTADNPRIMPRHYSVSKHYGGDRANAILGRAVSARIDLLKM
jgi:hypothetical protein